MGDPDSSQATPLGVRKRRHRLIELVPLILVAAVVALGLLEKQVFSYGPPCALHWLTGLNCPGCGGTRAFFALVHGDLSRSLRFNPLTLVVLFALVMWVLRSLAARLFPRSRLARPLVVSTRALWIVAVFVILFGILRNLPWWPFTLLAPPV